MPKKGYKNRYIDIDIGTTDIDWTMTPVRVQQYWLPLDVLFNRPVSMGTLKPLSGVIKLTLPIETPVIHVQGGFKVPMETGRNLEHTTERHQRGFKVPMETGSMLTNAFDI